MSTVTDVVLMAANVSPLNSSFPTTLKSSSNKVRFGKFLKIVKSNPLKSTVAFTLLLISDFTLARILSFIRKGTAISSAISTTKIMAIILRAFFILYWGSVVFS
ncbi:MAG: hypothetical protein BWY67_01796 [Bacteroidetes bacterium ADurb.Bin397]|nr:MAG: hypothetical protein BWY67_01796 [Bacteroidetes bacterium ADurb.Bin397]